MVAKKSNNTPVAAAPARKVRILTSPMFWSSYENHKRNKVVVDALSKFVQAKRDNPLAPYGAKDYPFRGDGPLKGFGHAGLTFDVSVIYTISGRDPHVIRLLGVFSHDELGTGQPAAINRQKKAAKAFASQTDFSPLSTIDESVRRDNALLQELLSL